MYPDTLKSQQKAIEIYGSHITAQEKLCMPRSSKGQPVWENFGLLSDSCETITLLLTWLILREHCRSFMWQIQKNCAEVVFLFPTGETTS